MTGKRDWLDAGLAIVAELGARALTIERLTERMGLTKGSFYHHFGAMGGFVTALLAHFETQDTTRFIDLAERDPAPARVKIRRLVDLTVAENQAEGRDLEIGVRSWAQQDPEVAAALRRVDRIRVDYLRELWREIGGDDEADDVALLLYVVTIGAGHVLPPVEPAQMRRLYDLVLRLDPARAE